MNPTAIRNALVAGVAMVLTVVLALAVQVNRQQVSLGALAAQSTDWEVAQTNGQPTLLEFYADWCGSCRAMAPMLAEVKALYGERVNFVMLNVDNPRWLPELDTYKVNGIPHFVFLDADNQRVAEAVGELPRAVLVASLEALVTGGSLDTTKTLQGTTTVLGRTSALPPTLAKPVQPRSHG